MVRAGGRPRSGGHRRAAAVGAALLLSAGVLGGAPLSAGAIAAASVPAVVHPAHAAAGETGDVPVAVAVDPTTTIPPPITPTTVPETTTTTSPPTTTTTTTTTTVPATTTTSSSTTTTTLAPLVATNTSSKTPWPLIIVVVVLVLAIGVLIVVWAARRRRGVEATWRRAVVPALSDAQLARASLLSENAVSADSEVRSAVAVQVERAAAALEHTVPTAPDPDAGQMASAAAAALRGLAFAVEADRLLRHGSAAPTGMQLAEADEARRARTGELSTALTRLSTRVAPRRG